MTTHLHGIFLEALVLLPNDEQSTKAVTLEEFLAMDDYDITAKEKVVADHLRDRAKSLKHMRKFQWILKEYETEKEYHQWDETTFLMNVLSAWDSWVMSKKYLLRQ